MRAKNHTRNTFWNWTIPYEISSNHFIIRGGGPDQNWSYFFLAQYRKHHLL